jgi:hypothetical protein
MVFTPPVVAPAMQGQPIEFQAKATSLFPARGPLELELVLSGALANGGRYPMKWVEGAYRATAVPFPPAKGPLMVGLEIKFAEGALSGRTEDRVLKLGQQSFNLSQVSDLRLGTKSRIQLNSGKMLDGTLAGLESMQLKVGEQSLPLDLSTAQEVKVNPLDDGGAITCTVVARQGGQEVGRLSEPLYLEGSVHTSLEAIRDGRFIKPPRSAAPVTYLRAVSSPGDYIGQGKTYTYGREDLTVRRSDRGVQITVGGIGGWQVLFGAPRGRFLEVGEYLDAKRYPFSNDAPGIEFRGYGRGANRIAGKFAVWEFEVQGNDIVRLAIDFVQRCEETMPPLYGKVRFNSSFH